MDYIYLTQPTLEFSEDVMNFRKEIINADDSDSFAGCGTLRQCTTMKEWLSKLEQLRNPASIPKNYVESDTYLAVRSSDKRVVGIIDLRHNINTPILSLWGGHIGYTIRPSERRKGYAKEMLRLNLLKCKGRNMGQVMITCSRNNTASEKTILANGGIFDTEVLVDGDYIKRYWIQV